MSIPDNAIIGFIGTGNMGMAIIKGLVKHVTSQQIIAYDIDKAKTDLLIDHHGISPATSPTDLAKRATIVVLAVKPQHISSILNEIKKNLISDTILVSIAAGVKITTLQQLTSDTQPIVRVMPNTPALISEGMTVLSPNDYMQKNDINIVEEIFTHIGKTLILSEIHMDAVTAISGSGPAYVFTFIQSLVDAGVKLGIPRDKALLLACQTIIGSAKLVIESNDDPISLRGKVTSPGGTTIEAVHVLEKSGFSGIVMDAVEAAAQKSKKLGE